jgi:hypothetical protein
MPNTGNVQEEDIMSKPVKISDRVWLYRGIEIRMQKGLPNSNRRSKNFEYSYVLPRPAHEIEIAAPATHGYNIKYVDGIAYTFKRKHTIWLESTVCSIDQDLAAFENNGWKIIDAVAMQEVK